jgi:cell division septation protein DedD
MTGVASPIRADLPPPQSTSQAVLGDTVESLPSGRVQSSTDQASSTQGTGQIISASMAQSSVASPTIVWKSVPGTGNAIIQIGAFSTSEHAQKVIAQARRASNILQHAVGHVDHVITSRGVSVWRTRLTGLPIGKEDMICSILRQKGLTCVTVH